MKTRVIPALVITFVVSAAAVTRAQLLVTDVLALAEHTTEVALQKTITLIRQAHVNRVNKMSRRLSTWVSLARYVIDRAAMPRWRHHRDTDEILYAKPYYRALTYGDPTGDGYGHVTRPRTDPRAALEGLAPAAKAVMHSRLAMLDLVDSAVIRDTHVAGQHRFGGRAELEAIVALQDMVVDEDHEQSLAAVLDKVSAAAMVALQNKQTRAALETALLEQLLVEQTVEREGEAALMNLTITRMQAANDEEGVPSIVGRATQALRAWRLR